MLSRFVIAFLLRSKRLLISWLQSPSTVMLEPKKIKYATVSIVPHLIAMKWWDWKSSSFFWRLSFKPAFSLSSFTFIKRLFNSSSLSAIRVVSFVYLRLQMIDRQIQIEILLALFLWRTVTNKTRLFLRPAFQNSSLLRSSHWNPTHDAMIQPMMNKKCYCGELGQTQGTGVDWICGGWAGETSKVSSTIHISIKQKTSEVSSKPQQERQLNSQLLEGDITNHVKINHRATVWGFQSVTFCCNVSGYTWDYFRKQNEKRTDKICGKWPGYGHL